MSIVSAIVLLAVVWFMTLFVVLPIGLKTQGDVGDTLEGTHPGSPATGFSMKRKLRITTIVAIPIWAVISGVIIWGGITVRDIDFFDRMGPESEQN